MKSRKPHLGEIRIVVNPNCVETEVFYKGHMVYNQGSRNDGTGFSGGATPLSKEQMLLVDIADFDVEFLRVFLKPYKIQGTGNTGAQG
jgi:hypothetical protein